MIFSTIKIGFQAPATPIMEGIIDLHNYILFYLILIFVFVFLMFGFILKQFFFDHYNDSESVEDMERRYTVMDARNIVHGTVLEVVWTVTPSLLLALIAIPSFSLLYAMDEVIDPIVTLKVIGKQWYWTYEYSDYIDENGEEHTSKLGGDSYMLPESDLIHGLRLLETDNIVVLPTNTHIRVIITAADVLHSWAVPSFGIKVDAVPGRLNQTSLFINMEGSYFGQCSEICGVNHGFMPIEILAVRMDDFIALTVAPLELSPIQNFNAHGNELDMWQHFYAIRHMCAGFLQEDSIWINQKNMSPWNYMLEKQQLEIYRILNNEQFANSDRNVNKIK